MSDVRIDKLARAYREEHDGQSELASRTRAAILRQHEARREQRGWLMAAAALLAMTVTIPTAWALYTGRLFGEPVEPAITAPAERAVPASTVAPPGRPELVAPEPTLPEPGPTLPGPTLPGPTLPGPTLPGAPVPERRLETPRSPEPVASLPELDPAMDELDRRAPIDPAERRAYEEAHALHFDARDAAGAVHAWDRYLSSYPRGRFAPEARYNRALALVRLGRRSEAIEALRPFAEGAHGSYRRREATDLLEALETTP